MLTGVAVMMKLITAYETSAASTATRNAGCAAITASRRGGPGSDCGDGAESASRARMSAATRYSRLEAKNDPA